MLWYGGPSWKQTNFNFMKQIEGDNKLCWRLTGRMKNSDDEGVCKWPKIKIRNEWKFALSA